MYQIVGGRFIFEAWRVYQITSNNSPLIRTVACSFVCCLFDRCDILCCALFVRARSPLICCELEHAYEKGDWLGAGSQNCSLARREWA
jgi:hypothetical protein